MWVEEIEEDYVELNRDLYYTESTGGSTIHYPSIGFKHRGVRFVNDYSLWEENE
jgi:hypothetical protein